MTGSFTSKKENMTKNMGSRDATVRLVIACIILALWGFKVISGPLAALLLVLSGIFVLTSLVQYCPLYPPFGINTRAKKKD